MWGPFSLVERDLNFTLLCTKTLEVIWTSIHITTLLDLIRICKICLPILKCDMITLEDCVLEVSFLSQMTKKIECYGYTSSTCILAEENTR